MEAHVVRDVVCGMKFSVRDAVVGSEYGGQVYWFCSPSCKHLFDSAPESFLRNSGNDLLDKRQSGVGREVKHESRN